MQFFSENRPQNTVASKERREAREFTQMANEGRRVVMQWGVARQVGGLLSGLHGRDSWGLGWSLGDGTQAPSCLKPRHKAQVTSHNAPGSTITLS
jgi:hypothetical protein